MKTTICKLEYPAECKSKIKATGDINLCGRFFPNSDKRCPFGKLATIEEEKPVEETEHTLSQASKINKFLWKCSSCNYLSLHNSKCMKDGHITICRNCSRRLKIVVEKHVEKLKDYSYTCPACDCVMFFDPENMSDGKEIICSHCNKKLRVSQSSILLGTTEVDTVATEPKEALLIQDSEIGEIGKDLYRCSICNWGAVFDLNALKTAKEFMCPSCNNLLKVVTETKSEPIEEPLEKEPKLCHECEGKGYKVGCGEVKADCVYCEGTGKQPKESIAEMVFNATHPKDEHNCSTYTCPNCEATLSPLHGEDTCECPRCNARLVLKYVKKLDFAPDEK